MSHFVLADRKTDYLLPPSVDDWLTQDHLARFVVEVIDQLDLSNLTRKYAGRGSKAYPHLMRKSRSLACWLRGIARRERRAMSSRNWAAGAVPRPTTYGDRPFDADNQSFQWDTGGTLGGK